MKEKLVLKKSVKIFISKVLITIIIFLIGMILIKANPNLKENIQKDIYENNFKFMKNKINYEKYFGNFLSLDKVIKNEQSVFNETLSYSSKEKYHDGVKLTVSNNYLVPTLESGIIVFIGNKDKYGNTIIIEQIDGIDTFYSNINLTNYKLYDYVEKGELLGEVKTNDLYLVFQKNGKYLNYEKYI